MDFSKYKFHPSSFGLLMTNQPGKKDTKNISELGETAKKYLLECWISEYYGREKDITSKYMEKGTLQEEESITLYSRATKQMFFKNKEEIKNDYFIGTPDLFKGESITNATEVMDIKTSWDIFTFFSVLVNAINPRYRYQLNGYCDLTGAKIARLVYALVDTPEHLINDEKRKLAWQMNVIDPDANPEFLLKAAQIEKNLTFGDIPIEDRWIEFEFQRNDEELEKMKLRANIGREFLDTLSMAKMKKEITKLNNQ